MVYIEVIKQIMFDNDLSQQKLADILGVNQTTISQWLLGNKKPNYDNEKDIEQNKLKTYNKLQQQIISIAIVTIVLVVLSLIYYFKNKKLK